MPQYTYTGDPDRYYPTLALTPEPGSIYDLARNPGDERWTPPDPEPAAGPDPVAEADPDKPAPKAGMRAAAKQKEA